MGFDCKQTKQFLKNLQKLEYKIPALLESYLLKKARKALYLTKENTPVDTGNLADNWYLSEVEYLGDKLVVYICNDVEYASYVEFGHETANKSGYVPGQYMSTISIQEIESEMSEELQAEFYVLCKMMGAC